MRIDKAAARKAGTPKQNGGHAGSWTWHVPPFPVPSRARQNPRITRITFSWSD
jgi:hypothetical protein